MGIKESLIRLGDADSAKWQLTFIEGSTLYLNNCRSIKSCDENYIVLQTAGGCLQLTGTDLVIEGYNGRGVMVSGSIHSITLED